MSDSILLLVLYLFGCFFAAGIKAVAVVGLIRRDIYSGRPMYLGAMMVADVVFWPVFLSIFFSKGLSSRAMNGAIDSGAVGIPAQPEIPPPFAIEVNVERLILASSKVSMVVSLTYGEDDVAHEYASEALHILEGELKR